jgi:hypothetical protein
MAGAVYVALFIAGSPARAPGMTEHLFSRPCKMLDSPFREYRLR